MNKSSDEEEEMPPESFIGDFNKGFVDWYNRPPASSSSSDKDKDEDEDEKADIVKPKNKTSSIDYSKREQMWMRVEREADSVTEDRVRAMVQLAEHLDADSVSDCEYEKEDSEPDWVPDEWIQWGEYIDQQQQQHENTQTVEEMMRERLDWVHSIQQTPTSLLSGFRDRLLANGKLQRAYSEPPYVTLQAYRDGNVKRTRASVTTLYFSNGDWQCQVSPQASYYYYHDERVWHFQDGEVARYTYPDGHVEEKR